MRKGKKWVVVFDFDGTFTPKGKSLFVMIDERALPSEGLKAQQEIYAHFIHKALAGKLTASEDKSWLLKSIKNYLRYGLTREKARTALSDASLRRGVRECLEMLRRAKVPVAIISYGIAPLIELVLDENGITVPGPLIRHIYAAKFLVETKAGRFVGYDRQSLVLQSTKGEWSRHFADACGVPYRNILAVGDSGGDKKLGYLKENRLAIAKNPEQAAELAPYMGTVAVTEDFGPVTAWLRSKLGPIK